MKTSTHSYLNRVEDITDSFTVQTHLLVTNESLSDQQRTDRMKKMNTEIHRRLTIVLSKYIVALRGDDGTS